MFGILAEDRSDGDALKIIMGRLLNDDSIPIKPVAYKGGGNLLKKGFRDVQVMVNRDGCKRVIVCHDSDGPDDSSIRRRIMNEVVQKSGLGEFCCIVVPVQELEAWILADIEAVTKVFPSWKPKAISNPEGIPHPKEYLVRLCRKGRISRQYDHPIDNPRVAHHLDLQKVSSKCPSFRHLVQCLSESHGKPSLKERG